MEGKWIRPAAFCLFLALSGMFSLTWTVSVSAAPDAFPVPKWLDSITVAEHLVINGLPSSVQYFEAEGSTEDLLEFYRDHWKVGRAGKPGYREVTVKPWHILSRIEGHYLYTVQVQENGPFKIKGYLAAGDLKNGQKKPDRNIENTPKMKGSRIVNSSTSMDPGKKGTTLLLVNGFSPDSNAEFYRSYYLDRGWVKLIDKQQKDSRILSFRRFGAETNLVINHGGGATQVVMNIVEQD